MSLTQFDLSTLIGGWTFSDGVHSIAQAAAVSFWQANNYTVGGNLLLETDASGDISSWYIFVDYPTDDPKVSFYQGQARGGSSTGGPLCCSMGTPHGSEIFAVPEYQVGGTGEGTWSATPLPATLPLFLTRLGALGLMGWKKNRNRRSKILN